MATWALLVSPSLVTCAAEPESPEARVRTVLTEAEVAAAQKNLGGLRDLVSDRHAGDRGHNTPAIIGILTFHFLRHQSIHLFSRVRSIAFPDAARAVATVFAPTAGQPIPTTAELSQSRERCTYTV